jgi:hypothetical protein
MKDNIKTNGRQQQCKATRIDETTSKVMNSK